MTSDPGLEAKMRFSPRSILDDSFLGKGVALWRGGSGFLPRLPRERGGGKRGLMHPASVTCLGGGGGQVIRNSHDLTS